MNLEGPHEGLSAAREHRAAKMQKTSLGLLIEQFIGEHLSTGFDNGRVERKNATDRISEVNPRVAISYVFSLSSEAYEGVKASLGELVALRNELVHHLIERFDISNTNACLDAALYLDRCYLRIESSCQQLKAWATALDDVRAKAASLVQSPMFENAFVHGVDPDGTVSWERSSVVADLRLAEQSCQIEGWVPLNAALEFIRRKDRAQVPTRYGCKTWRQLLKRSELFEIKCIVEAPGAGTQTWYRSLTS